MEQIQHQDCEQLRRRIRFLQRSLVQLASQPQLQRQQLYHSLFASLHAARRQLREVSANHSQQTEAVA